MGAIGELIATPFNLAAMYTEKLNAGVTPQQFCRKPKGIDCNHPAFNFGHLANYPERLLEMIGRPELVDRDANFVELFSAGKPCLDDPEGKIYPSMDKIMSRFNTRYQVALKAVREAPDSVFNAPNPNERMKDLFPTIGVAAAFLLDGHLQSHLGQISTWRRCMGLGSAL